MAKNKKGKKGKGDEPEDAEEATPEPKNAKGAKGAKGAKSAKADDAEPAEDAEGGEGGEDGGKKKLPIMKLAIFAGAPVLLIVIGLGAAFFLGVFGGKKHEAKAGADKVESIDGKPVAADVQFLDLPEILVNLNTGGKGSAFLKLQLAIEMPKEAKVELVQPALPRIMDRFQVFLRELRFEDLAGSAGTYRLKQELLRRVRLSGLAVPVNDVLIREMIIQ